jgi:acylphosphatase
MAMTAGGDIVAIRARIRGWVQGVGYRDWTMRRAEALGLLGWVRNRVDGSVEALFVGRRADIDRMLADCRRGPAMARVESVTAGEEPVVACDGFSFRPTV